MRTITRLIYICQDAADQLSFGELLAAIDNIDDRESLPLRSRDESRP